MSISYIKNIQINVCVTTTAAGSSPSWGSHLQLCTNKRNKLGLGHLLGGSFPCLFCFLMPTREAGEQTPHKWKLWPFSAPLPCCSTSAEGAGPEHWIFCFLSPAQPGTAALAKASQVGPGLLPPPQPAARPSYCPVIYTSSKEVSSAPELQRCYSPKCQDRRYNMEVGKFTCWARCRDIHTEKKPTRMKSKQLNWYKKGHFP